jgi:hypothetical protein
VVGLTPGDTFVLRRALAVAFAAASIALVPAAASAAPEQAPVSTTTGSSYSAYTQFQLEDGRQVNASIGQFRDSGSRQWQRSLSVSISKYCYPVACDAGTGYAYVTLSEDQVSFDRGLREFALPELTVTLQRMSSWDPVTGPTYTEEEVSIDLVFTGTGPVDRWAEHGKICGDGERECESIRNYASRDAIATVTLDGVSQTAPGAMSFAHGIDAAAPDFEYPGGY